MEKELPKGWVETTLGESFIIERGGSPRPIEEYITDSEDGINWIKIGDTKNVNKFIYSTKEKIKPEGLKKSRMVYDGDFILSNSMSFGRPYIMKTNGCIHDGWLVIRKNENIDNNFLYYLLSSNLVYQQFSSLAKGSTVKNLNIQAVQKVKVALPPLNEQIRIAFKLDTLFAHLEQTKKRLEQIPVLLKQFRQAVLTQAVTGKLTEEWREGKELGEWKKDRLDNFAETRLGKMLDKNKNIGLPYRYLGNINVRWFEFDLDDLNELLIKEDEANKFKLFKNDVLVCEGGEPGRAAIWKQDNSKIIYQKALHRVRLKPKVLPEFFVYNLKNDCDKDTMKALFTGTTIKHLTGKQFANYEIFIPPLPEQTEIVRRVESLFAKADAIEARYKVMKELVDKLPQAILGKAFRGEV